MLNLQQFLKKQNLPVHPPCAFNLPSQPTIHTQSIQRKIDHILQSIPIQSQPQVWISKRHWQKSVQINKNKTNPFIKFVLYFFLLFSLFAIICSFQYIQQQRPEVANVCSHQSPTKRNVSLRWLRSSVHWNLKTSQNQTPSDNTALVGYKNSFLQYAPACAKKWLPMTTQLLLPYKNTTQTKVGEEQKGWNLWLQHYLEAISGTAKRKG